MLPIKFFENRPAGSEEELFFKGFYYGHLGHVIKIL